MGCHIMIWAKREVGITVYNYRLFVHIYQKTRIDMLINNIRRIVVMKRNVNIMRYWLIMDLISHQEFTCSDLMIINMVIIG